MRDLRLTGRDKAILAMWCGLDGEFHTHKEMAARFGVSKSRIGQLINKAVRKVYLGENDRWRQYFNER